MNKIINSVKEREILRSNERQTTYALLLKRKRLEKSLTLEMLSYGVCSTSYLSKIENCQVDPDEYYIKALFEKLDINYESVVKERNENILVDFLKKYLVCKDLELEEQLNQIISSQYYCDTEKQIALLFIDLITEKYEEVQIIINSLNKYLNSLSDLELSLLSFLVAVYYYKTQQIANASEQLEALKSSNIDNNILQIAVLDLSIDVYFLSGETGLQEEAYQQLLSHKSKDIVNKKLLLHKMKKLITKSKLNFNETMGDFKIIMENINKNNKSELENYYYMNSRALFANKEYTQAIELLIDNTLSGRIVAMIAQCIGQIEDKTLQQKYISYIENYQFRETETIYSEYCELIKLIVECDDEAVTYNYAKNMVISYIKTRYAKNIFDSVYSHFIRLGYNVGKYKDVLKIINKVNKLIED